MPPIEIDDQLQERRHIVSVFKLVQDLLEPSGVSLSRSTVKRALDDLVKAGLVEKSSRWRENESLTSNLYRIK